MKDLYIVCHMMTSVDGRKGMAAVFDGLPMEQDVIQLKLKDVTKYENGAIWIRYMVK